MPATAPASGAPRRAAPLTAGLNQFRDNYGTQIIEIQLSNTSSVPVTVLGADVSSTLFPAGAAWQAGPEGTEVPPGQTKSLPARLPAPSCQSPAEDAARPHAFRPRRRSPSGRDPQPATVRMAAADPFGVLARNHAELCLARDAGRMARFGLAPDLEVAADGRTAVVRLSGDAARGRSRNIRAT